MKSDKRKFLVLNKKLVNLLDEQLELELILNPLINWDTGWLQKEHLDLKYAGREFNISYDWRKIVSEENFKKSNGGNWNEEILNDNEDKRQIFFKLSKRKNELSEIILKIIDELMFNNLDLTDDQLKEIFK